MDDGVQLSMTLQDIVDAMVKAVNEYSKMKDIALTKGTEYVKNNFTWKHATDKLLMTFNALSNHNTQAQSL